MLKSDLVTLLVEKRHLSQKQAEASVDRLFQAMTAGLARGENLELRGFGSFHVRSYKGRKGRNPKTSEEIEVRPKRGVLFRVGKELRERINRAVAPVAAEEGSEPAA